MFRPMKPETIARHAAERIAAQAASQANLRARLVLAVARHGPKSLYADLLAEHDARHRESSV